MAIYVKKILVLPHIQNVNCSSTNHVISVILSYCSFTYSEGDTPYNSLNAVEKWFGVRYPTR